MTTPGGVTNLPTGALTLETMQARLQDMSGGAMRARAGERFPSIMGGSSGGTPLSDFTPFGILTRIWAEFNSAVANADPADINGPEDLPELLLQFIENLPVIGEFVGLLEAILGTYDGDDEVLLQIQSLFRFLRADGMIDASKLFGELPEAVLSTVVDVIVELVRRLLNALGIPIEGSLLDQIMDLADGLADWQADTDSTAAGLDDLLGGLLTHPDQLLGGALGLLLPKSDWSTLLTQFTAAGNNGTAPSTGIPALDNMISSFLGVRSTANGANSTALNAASTASSAQSTANNAASAASTAQSLANAAQSAVASVAEGIFNGWFGTGATGTAAEAKQTIEAIKTMVIAGYTVETIMSTQTWNRPAGTITEFYAVLIGGGGKGANGASKTGNSGTQSAAGGAKGLDGGYLAEQIEPGDLPSSATVTVGAAATTAGANGQPSSFGSLASSNPGNAGIGTTLGYTTTSSKPGSGGDGASASMTGSSAGTITPATAGQSSALATAGQPGTSSGPATGSGTAGNGTAGGDAALTGRSKSGGGGGGGGGAAARGNALVTATGGRGGDGGFPGGASGGGGAAVAFGSPATANPGQSGTPAKGIVFLIYKVVPS